MSEQFGTRVPLSVLVPVTNEAANLRDCLARISFAQEIVVVDSASTAQALAKEALDAGSIPARACASFTVTSGNRVFVTATEEGALSPARLV